jgi:hypothetical protein
VNAIASSAELIAELRSLDNDELLAADDEVRFGAAKRVDAVLASVIEPRLARAASA